MIAALGVQSLHGRDGLLKGLSLGGIGDGVVVKGQEGVVASLDGFGDVAHECVERLGSFYQANGEDEIGSRVVGTFYNPLGWREIGVPIVSSLDRYIVLGEHLPGAET